MSDKDRLLAEWQEIQQMEFWRIYSNRIIEETQRTMRLMATGVRSGSFEDRAMKIIELQGKVDGMGFVHNLPKKIAEEIGGATEEKK